MEKVIQEIDRYCKKEKIDIRFVGGVSFGGLLTKKTTWKIDIKNKKIYLYSPQKLLTKRPDGTYKDIDAIVLSKNRDILFRLLSQKEYNKHIISIESPIFYPQKVHTFSQFVTSIIVDSKNIPYLQFGQLKKAISWNSLESWQVILPNNMSYTVRNPIADYFAYQFRSPGGIKQKDKEKIRLLKILANDVIKKGKLHRTEYMSSIYYGPWEQFTIQLRMSSLPSIQIKRIIMKIYWSTIGETFAHGKGIGKYFLSFSNQFTGIRQ